MFGVKVKVIQTNHQYTIEEFYSAIKDTPFSAGAPALTKHGFSTIVTFPPLDRRNQIWILPVIGLKSKSTNKFQISKNEVAGVGNAAVNMALNDLTGGLLGFKGIIGKNVKAAEKLIDLTVEEINALKP